MQIKKYFLLMITLLFFKSTVPFMANLKEKFNQNKKVFITAGIGVAALVSYLMWYFLFSKDQKNRSTGQKDQLGIQKKNLQNEIHNVIQFIEKTNSFINNYSTTKKIGDFNQKLVDWNVSLGNLVNLSKNYDKLEEKNVTSKQFQAINKWFNTQRKNIEEKGNAVLDLIFYKDNHQESLYLMNNKYVLVDIYKQPIDNSPLYFRGLDLFNGAEQKNVKNVNVFEWGSTGEKHEISKYGFYEYTSKLQLTPKFGSQ